MANHKSAEKRIRRNESRTILNHSRLARIRSFVKKVEVAVTAGDKTQASVALLAVQPELMRGVSKGVVPQNAAARKLSRLSARVSSMA